MGIFLTEAIFLQSSKFGLGNSLWLGKSCYFKKLTQAIFLQQIGNFFYAVLFGAKLEKFLMMSWEIFCLWQSFCHLPRYTVFLFLIGYYISGMLGAKTDFTNRSTGSRLLSNQKQDEQMFRQLTVKYKITKAIFVMSLKY